MTLCNSCSGQGGIVMDGYFQLHFEVCLHCGGYGWINKGESDDKPMPEV